MRIRKPAGILTAAVSAAVFTTVLGAVPAQAATSTCNSTVRYDTVTGATTTLPSYGGSVSCVLGSGNSSSAVRALQVNLNECYDAGLTADGIFGPATKAALRHAQSRAGVTADGVYGPRTRDAIWWRIVGFACDHVDGPGGLGSPPFQGLPGSAPAHP
ncbi:peptidoglycan-binding protein [Streptomyces sp. NPDC051018]|uniref:peptidoglycan-binding protein n=1 Tax=Streptomyces sp. NPDC051018 TaxID=3365639 RepID=UPI003798A502